MKSQTKSIAENWKMNLIEKLGGYEKARDVLEKLITAKESRKSGKKSKLVIFDDWIDTVNDALLQYRREHDIYEEGDSIVMILEQAHDDIRVIEEIYEDGRVCLATNGRRLRISLSSGYMIHRHATPEEIQAGRRLP